MEISALQAQHIGQGIFLNECSGRMDRLVWWNTGENFASLGIGHFIWYPNGIHGPFEETFPALLSFFKEQNVELPDWLKAQDCCPWSTKEEFSDKGQDAKKKELQDLLSRTLSLQALFIAKRFEKALPQILSAMSLEKKGEALRKIKSLEETSEGKFALIDYLNFKGYGILESERYNGKGWGLKQVLEEMPLNTRDPLKAFCETAKALLEQRVLNSPRKKQEELWLKGWLCRVDRYERSI